MRKGIIVAGLMFGDEGKGSIVDALVRQTGATLVVRYNGGPQAAHHVVTANATHRFSMFGSGTLAGATTYLSRFVAIDPILIQAEATRLQTVASLEPWKTLIVSDACPVITPYHRWLNRLRETSRGAHRHGSCGIGVGELLADLDAHRTVIWARDLNAPSRLLEKMEQIRREKLAQAGELPNTTDEALEPMRALAMAVCQQYRSAARFLRMGDAVVGTDDTVIFEGAHGTLLDEWQGFHPYTTWADCTWANALKLADELHCEDDLLRLGVLRAFTTRHGPGPFPTEDINLGRLLDNDLNQSGLWQGDMRVGHFDAVLLRYALDVMGGADMLALTCLDRVRAMPRWQAAARYAIGHGLRKLDTLPVVPRGDLTAQSVVTEMVTGTAPLYDIVDNPLDYIQVVANTPVGILSRGPLASDKTFRPVWEWRQAGNTEIAHV